MSVTQGHETITLLPVSQEYTHKTNTGEVLLRSWQPVADDTFTVTAEWPDTHSFYAPRNGLHDPLQLSETIRQTLPLLSHGAYGVPFGHQLLWQDFSWEIDREASRSDGSPAELELRIRCFDVTYRKDRASAMSLNIEAERSGRHLATARTRFTIQDPTVYRRLRGRYADKAAANAGAVPLPPPAAMSPFGRDSFADVVLASTDLPHRWQLRADTAHPILFDHPVDHAPGMLLLEAARQAALATGHPEQRVVLGMASVFSRYAELDSPCWITTEPIAAGDEQRRGEWSAQGDRTANRVRVSAEQNDREIFSSEVTLAPLHPAPLA
ncbi:ScbA/BarX family gamma-butyrolactone biosynthesis protein [Streptomyces peucetius]|uniref:ScbA/BarX family gamma-butyrolactone biosynthesis protein n=1 Tax=Streptomyces peucetius TaxID=1950 RepID=A0ABY6I9V7_STRPE|nr:ScbA/BarX family gamma-butyrolactone biosynthesis protein [Streptomyces peucetius]UYQ62642.1 ScbA/BarX family gamma-butyrolactone biosynthesis protein [Streptomyces peucetius]